MNDLLPTEGPGRDDLDRLYSWSLEDAEKAQEEWYLEHHPEGRGPLLRWIGAQQLKNLYHIYQTEKDQDVILKAIYMCSLNSLPIPRWCEMAYLEAYRKVRHYKAKSWDDVFGEPHPKGTHLKAKNSEREKSILVYQRIKEIKQMNPSIPIDGKLFERVGKEFGAGGKTLAEEYYYKWKNKFDEDLARSKKRLDEKLEV